MVNMDAKFLTSDQIADPADVSAHFAHLILLISENIEFK